MSRNAGGSYSLPAGNPVVSGTVIAASWANTTLSDLATEMTDSLDRSGKGGMLAALGLVSGTIAAPGVAFNSELSSGMYRAGANDVGFALNGVDRIRLKSASSTNAILFSSPQVAAGASEDFLFNTTNTRTGTNRLISVKNNSTEKFGVDTQGVIYQNGTPLTAGPWTLAQKTADQTGIGTIATDITGLSFTESSGKTYVIRGALLWINTSVTSAGSFQMAVKGSGGATNSNLQLWSSGDVVASSEQTTNVNAYDTFISLAGSESTSIRMVMAFYATITTTGTGTFQLQAKSGTATNLDIHKGSFLEYFSF